MWADKHTRNIVLLLILMTVLAGAIALQSNPEPLQEPINQPTSEKPTQSPMWDEVKDGIHLPSGLMADANFELVVQNCTACHSADIIKQSKLTADGWVSIIRWMQEKQNLWDLGPNEAAIVAYLAKNYAPKQEGRRKNLSIASSQWYELED